MKIEVYSVPGCHYCVKLRRLLDRSNLEYIQTTVTNTAEFKALHPNCKGFPWVFVDGVEVGGIVETAKLLLQKGLVKRRR